MESLPDDTTRLADLLATAARRGGNVTIPPGDYHVAGTAPIALPSGVTVKAYGARFHLPLRLGDGARAVAFGGENVRDLRWLGGHFVGHVFDPAESGNTWEPNANTRGIVITTSPGGVTDKLIFRDVTSDGLAGAAITVMGALKEGSDREVTTFARGVSIEVCALERTGKLMWDYGYLWQITVWPEDHTPAERAMAARYFPATLVRHPVQMDAGDDRVRFDGAEVLPISNGYEPTDPLRGLRAICFYGDRLPSNIVRGRQYFVVDSAPGMARIAETAGGEAIRFEGSAGPETRIITDLFLAHPLLYEPTGSGPGKGALDLVGCENVTVRGCRLSALGDAMHIQRSRDIVFANNQITGARMGAFFLAEYCRKASVTGNIVDGTNGSRVMSVERSCEDVTIAGNTFRNGGRGSWMNQPRNLLLADNVFVNNTTKCEPNPQRGRRSFVTGGYESYAELYFTTYEPGGRYGNVTVSGNLFISGEHAAHAITFANGGDTIVVTANALAGPIRDIVATDGCENVVIRGNRELPESGRRGS